MIAYLLCSLSWIFWGKQSAELLCGGCWYCDFKFLQLQHIK